MVARHDTTTPKASTTYAENNLGIGCVTLNTQSMAKTMLTKIEERALADLVAHAIEQRQKAANELNTTTNTEFLESLLEKLGGDLPKQGWQMGGCRRPNME